MYPFWVLIGCFKRFRDSFSSLQNDQKLARHHISPNCLSCLKKWKTAQGYFEYNIYLFHVSPRTTRVRWCLSGLLILTDRHTEHASYIPKKYDILKSVRYVARIMVTCNSLIWKWAPKLSNHMSFSSSTLTSLLKETIHSAHRLLSI